MYSNAQYLTDSISNKIIGIMVTMNNMVYTVPLDPANTDYANIVQLVKEGKLTITPSGQQS